MATEQDLAALSPADRERLERLAELCERTPLDMLYFVQRDGFDECEESARETLLAERDIALNGTVPHEEVMEEVKRILAGHGERSR